MHYAETSRQNITTCPTSIRKKSNAVRQYPLRIWKNNISRINFESAIGQHLLANPECDRTCSDDNFRIIGEAGSCSHSSVLESVYIKTQNPVYTRIGRSYFHVFMCRFLFGTLQVNNGE